MKSILLFFVSFLFAVNLHYTESKRLSFEQIREALQPVKAICMERVGATSKMIDDANNGNFVSDRRLQCYYKCMMLMTKGMKNDKVMSDRFERVARTMLLEEFVEPMVKAIAHCQPTASQSLEGCELAFELAKCFYNYNPALSIYP